LLSHNEKVPFFEIGMNLRTYISVNLSTVILDGDCFGEWFGYDGDWYRLFDRDTFLWIRQMIQNAIASKTLSSRFVDAEAILERLATDAVSRGILTFADIMSDDGPTPSFQFWSGFPHEFDREYFEQPGSR